LFALQVSIPANDPNLYKVRVEIGWTNSGTTTQQSQTSDYDLYIYQPDVAGSKVGQGPGSSNPEIASFRVPQGDTLFTVYVVPYDVSPTVSFSGTISLENATPPPPPPLPNPNLPPGTPRLFNYMSPNGIADSFGEPSIGVNWNTGKVMMFGGGSSYAARVSFDDCSSPAKASWDRTPLFTNTLPRAAGGDPILFTDHETGRTFVSQLQFGTTTATGEYTDDDGSHYQTSQGFGIGSGIDHQTIGGGPFALGLTGAGYKNAMYYCAQDLAAANCALSLDGGRTWGPSVPIYTTADCGGIHGHVKVAPDGTVYVPARSCGSGQQGVAVSEDNGTTWTVHTVTNSTNGDTDPSIGIATDGTVYFGYEASNGHARIAVSRDKGKTWTDDQDVGSQLGIQNSVFPAVVAGDGGANGRAAYAFYGTTAPGNYNDIDFPGTWYLILATTMDGGKNWSVQNATPNDPVQRGSLCTLGINCTGDTRNLLDFFDATIDKQGRVLIGYDDGCVTTGCVLGDKNGDGIVDGRDNDFTAKAVIARQTGGKRMFSAYDPVEPTTPAAPSVTATKDSTGSVVHLSWSVPDNGGSPITGYRIYRRTTSSAFALLASIQETSFDDETVTPGTSYVYRVTAVNAFGEGPFCGEIVPVKVTGPVACATPGALAVSDINSDGSDFDIVPNSPADGRVNIRELYISEPFFSTGVNTLVFTLKVTPSSSGSAPPSSQWYILWNRLHPDSDFDRWYVAMKTDATGAPSFEYGKFGVPLDPTNPNPNANIPVRVGNADSGSYDVVNGVITITLSNSNAENIQAGQSLTALNVRTFLAQPDTGTKPQRTASDITDDSSYTLIGNAACRVNQAPTAILNAAPHQGSAPLTVSFNGTQSFDPDGDTISSYKFNFGDDSAPVTQQTPNVSHTYNAAGNYFATLIVTDSHGTQSASSTAAAIQVDPAQTNTECVEDDDARIAYSDGWHLVNDTDASGGHFRFHAGKSADHTATLTFNVASGQIGKITYYYATSPKGGSAEIFLDGVSKGTVNYKGTQGSTRAPVFGPSVEFTGLASGTHTLQIKNMTDGIYIDRFCLESSTASGNPATGPGTTSTSQNSLNANQQASQSVVVGTNATAISVVADVTPAVPVQLVLIDPSGSILQTANGSSGLVVLNAPVSKSGTYIVKVVNLSLGPVQTWVAATPTVMR
jgi:PKD repeat protein